MRVVVVGAGVIGLSAAVRLLEEGQDVTVIAERRTPRTTSDVAAAIHFPFLAEPRERIIPWAKATLARFSALAEAGDWGITWAETTVVGEGPEEPWWAPAVASWRPLTAHELPPGETHALVARVPVLTMPVYMARLEAEATRLGARFVRRRLERLEDVLAGCDVLVNCTGLGSRSLTPDRLVYPIRGQVLRVANPGIVRSVMREHAPLAYVIPRPDCIVLGGTAEVDDWDERVRAATESSIRRRCEALVPELAGLPTLGSAVGLRPGRTTIRLEEERRRTGRIIHCYGHGGSGVTLSWGCAQDVARLVVGP